MQGAGQVCNFLNVTPHQTEQIFAFTPRINTNQPKITVTYWNGRIFQVPMGGSLDALNDGEVIIQFPDQRKYEGCICHGSIAPNGKITYSNKDTYVGEVAQTESGNIVASGLGTYIFRSDKHKVRYYEGEFLNDQFDGHGKLYLPYGVYEGQFEQGLRHGRGQYTQQNGIQFTGNYWKDIRTIGEYKHPNGASYVGTFSTGEVVQGHFLHHECEYSSRPGNHEIRLYGSSAWVHGEFTFANGDSYCGKLNKGAPMGTSTVTVGNTGDVYRIYFKYGHGVSIGEGYCETTDQTRLIIVKQKETVKDGRTLELVFK